MDQDRKADTGKTDEIGALVTQLGDIERRLQALTEGQVDAVVDPQTGTPIVLQHAQRQLRRSEARLRLVLEQLPAVVWTTDAKLRLQSLSGGELWGRPDRTKELLGKHLSDLDGRFDVDKALQAHRQALEGETTTFELTVRERIYDCSVEPMQGPEGEIVGCVGLAVDVTPRVKMTEALRESREHLEERVKERTEELSHALEELRVSGAEIRQQNEELVAAQRELEKERRRYHELFAFAPDGYLVTDAEGTIEEVNQVAAELLGVRSDFLVGKPLGLYLKDGDRRPFYRLMDRAAAARPGEAAKAELQVEPRDDTPFPAAVSAVATRDHDGDIAHIHWMVRDISRSRRLMEENRRQRRFMERLMEVAPVGIAVLRGDDHRFEMANTYYRNIAGVQPPVVGRTFEEVFPHVPDERGVDVFDLVYRAAQAVRLRELKGPVDPREGQTYWSVDVVPLQDMDGVVNGLLVITRDVSREARARKEIERLAVRTQRQADQLNAVFDAMTDAVIVYNARGVPVQANRAATDAYGTSPVGLERERLLSKLEVRTAQGQPAAVESLPSSRALRGEWVENARYRIRDADGDELMIVASAAPLREDGDVTGAVLVWHDVTERERLLAEVNAQRMRAQRLAADLERERDKLQTIMENTHAQLAYLDADFNFVHVNTAYAEGCRYDPEELVGRNHFELFPDPENEAIFERVVETGEPVSFRGKPFVYADQPGRGVTYWDWSLVPVTNGDDEVRGLVFSLLNVTEREQLMRQVEAEQARLKAVIENSPEGIVVADEQARITLTNPAADELYERSVPYGEAYGSHAGLNLCHPDGTGYGPRDLPLTRAALDGEVHEDVEMALIQPEGQRRELLTSTAPIRDREGAITGAVGIFRDITERKRIEEAVRRYAERLRVLHELDQAILTSQTAKEIADAALIRLRQLVDCRRASVELLDRQAGESTVLAVDAEGGKRLQAGRRMPLARVDSREDLRAGRLRVVEDLSRIRPTPTIEALREEGIQSFVSAPLQAGGELLGALNVGRTEIGTPTAEEMEAIREVAQQLAIGIQQARLDEQLQAYADELEERVAARTAQLRASEARFRAIFEQSALGIALLDRKGRVIVSNPGLQEILGRDEDEIHGRELTDFAHPDVDIQADLVAYRHLREGEQDHHRVEVRYVRPDDDERWATLVLSLVRDSRGQPQFIIAMVEDVTERRRAQEALRTSERRQGLALEALDGGIYEHRVPLDETTYHGKGWAGVLGYQKSELPPYDAFIDWLYDQVHPEDRDRLAEVYEAFVAGRDDRYQVEIRIRHKEGHWVWVEGLAEALERDDDGRATHVIGIMRDITERKEAHQALVQSEKLVTTGRLAASLAHEINNPLQTVIGCLGLAQESMDGGENEVEAYVDMAHDELQRAARIVSRLRDLNRPTELGRGEPTDLNVLIDEVLKVSRKDLKNHGVFVSRDLAEDLPQPRVMADRIKQVFLNLLLNARDAMRGGGEVTVGTAHDEKNDEVRVTVSDQGPGIPPDVMDRIFDPFFSTKEDGTGLGLFVSRNIVEEEGGWIEVESAVGEGATFTVVLPVEEDQGGALPRQDPT